MNDQYIESFAKLKEKPIANVDDLEVLKGQVINLLIRIYGPNSQQEGQIRGIEYQIGPVEADMDPDGTVHTYSGGDNLKSCTHRLRGLIGTFIEELRTFGPPSAPTHPASSGGDGINITVSQNQTVNVHIVIDALREELNGRQIRELQEILNSTEEPATKKQKLAEKIKSFGHDVATNILANILTNPQILGIC